MLNQLIIKLSNEIFNVNDKKNDSSFKKMLL